MAEQELKDYRNFMYDENNIGNCDNCPENVGRYNHEYIRQYPCGQQHCWVEEYCKSVVEHGRRVPNE